MNKLIILGNGFDLAHKLPTIYSDFINYYWSQINDSSYNDGMVSFVNPGYDFTNCKSLGDIQQHLFDSGDFNQPKILRSNFRFSTTENFIKYQNRFFHQLNENQSEVNWVDIEMEYYSSLREKMLTLNSQLESEVVKLNQ